jgi:zinc protease
LVWLAYLQGQYQDDEDVKEVLKEDEMLKKVTVESTKMAAKKYFAENMIKVILLPEKK